MQSSTASLVLLEHLGKCLRVATRATGRESTFQDTRFKERMSVKALANRRAGGKKKTKSKAHPSGSG